MSFGKNWAFDAQDPCRHDAVRVDAARCHVSCVTFPYWRVPLPPPARWTSNIPTIREPQGIGILVDSSGSFCWDVKERLKERMGKCATAYIPPDLHESARKRAAQNGKR